MAEGVIQVPPDSTGAKIRTRTRTVGVNTVHEQAFWPAANPTWYIWSGAVTPAANKHWLSFLNNSGSGQVFKVRKLFIQNLGTAAVTGGAVQLDVKRVTAISGGSAITPQIVDSTDTAIANVTCITGATSVTEGAVLFSAMSLTEENTATQPLTNAMFQQYNNLMPEGPELRELVLNAGEGITVKQITSVTAGSMAVLMMVTKEP